MTTACRFVKRRECSPKGRTSQLRASVRIVKAHRQLLTASVSVWLSYALSGCASASPTPHVAASAPEPPVNFSLPSDSGSLVTVPLSSASTTVLDAWAPTCEPCSRKLPALYAQRGQIEAHGGKLVLVAVLADGETTEDARGALSSWGVSAPFLVDHGSVMRSAAGVSALPATLVLDAKGVVRWVAPVNATVDDVIAVVTNVH